MDKAKKRPLTIETLRIFWRAAIAHPVDAWLALLYPVGILLTGIGIPYYIGRILGSLGTGATSTNKYVILLVLCSVVGVLANRYGFARVLSLQARAMNDLQHKTLDTLLRRSVGFHNDRISGKLVSDAIDFPNAFSTLINALYIQGLPFLLVIVSGAAIVMVHSWLMGVALLAMVVIIGTWTHIESMWRANLRTRRLAALKNVTAHLSDTIVNAQTVKAFGRESHESNHNLTLSRILRDLRMTDWHKSARSGNNRMIALLAFQIGFILLIVFLVRRNPGLLGVSIFALTYTLMLTQRLFDLNNIARQLEESFLQASPMTKILLEDIEIHDARGAKELKVDKGAIELQNIHFHYDGGSSINSIFSGLSLSVAPGEKIGLVGPSGGGKSTLTRLLLRFEDIMEGAILFDGQNIANVTQVSLRTQIAYVAQEPLLFHRTIRENIAYGRPEATDKEVIRAARQANAHDFIKALPQGYDTIVGERGVKLSGGQRQRVAIARAILKDAPILLLDEATSALDSESEALVQDALWKLMEGRTTIVIAHRLSTIQKMDRIIVLKDGQIAEQGTHKALIKQQGVYASLWSHQSGGFVPDDEA